MIDAEDGEPDALVDCGPGADTVDADAAEVDPNALFDGCESIDRPASGGDPPPPDDGGSPQGDGGGGGSSPPADGSSPPPGHPGGADAVAPRLRIVGRGLRLSRARVVGIRLRCPAAERSEPCRGRLALRTLRRPSAPTEALKDQIGELSTLTLQPTGPPAARRRARAVVTRGEVWWGDAPEHDLAPV